MVVSIIPLASTLVVLSISDLVTSRLPDILTGGLVATGVFLAASIDGTAAALGNAFAALVGFTALWAVSILYFRVRGRHGLGLGDAKLLAAAGAWLGLAYLTPVVFVGATLALLFVLCLRFNGRPVAANFSVPFGPFLSAASSACGA